MVLTVSIFSIINGLRVTSYKVGPLNFLFPLDLSEWSCSEGEGTLFSAFNIHISDISQGTNAIEIVAKILKG